MIVDFAKTLMHILLSFSNSYIYVQIRNVNKANLAKDHSKLENNGTCIRKELNQKNIVKY